MRQLARVSKFANTQKIREQIGPYVLTSPCYVRIAKALVGVSGCLGWSQPLRVAYTLITAATVSSP